MGAQEALNHLLQLKHASFYYYACESLDALPPEKTLKIDLKELIANWQIVPPMSSNDLLDKIFGDIEKTPEVETLSTKPKHQTGSFEGIKQLSGRDDSSSPFKIKQSDPEWELVNPLLVGGGPGDRAYQYYRR